MHDATAAKTSRTEQSKLSPLRGTASVGALMGGLLASSCCILPLVLVSLGAGGAWMSNLTALSPYQPVFLSLAVMSITGGVWLSRRAKNQPCALDGPCAKTITQKRYTIGLWVGGTLALTAVAVNILVPLFY